MFAYHCSISVSAFDTKAMGLPFCVRAALNSLLDALTCMVHLGVGSKYACIISLHIKSLTCVNDFWWLLFHLNSTSFFSNSLIGVVKLDSLGMNSTMYVMIYNVLCNSVVFWVRKWFFSPLHCLDQDGLHFHEIRLQGREFVFGLLHIFHCWNEAYPFFLVMLYFCFPKYYCIIN